MPTLTETIRHDDVRGASRDWILTVVLTPRPSLLGKSFALDGETVPLNRTPDDPNAIALYDPAVSEGRCVLRRGADGRYSIVDSGSRNTPRVDGVRVEGEVVLDGNNVLRLGDTLLVVERGDFSRRSRSGAADPLLAELCMFDSTAAAILELETCYFDSGCFCVGIEASGYNETRIVADWLSERWNLDLVRVDASASDVIEVLEGSDPDIAVLVERFDDVEDVQVAVRVADAIEYRATGPSPRRVAFSFSSDSPKSLASRLIETAMDCSISVPPLAERRVDILPALRKLIHSFDESVEVVFPPVCAEKLICYGWPAGLGEMRRIARRLHKDICENGAITRLGLTAEVRAVDLAPETSATRNLTHETYARAYRELGGNVSEIADYFGYNRGYFYKLLKKQKIPVRALESPRELVNTPEARGDIAIDDED